MNIFKNNKTHVLIGVVAGMLIGVSQDNYGLGIALALALGTGVYVQARKRRKKTKSLVTNKVVAALYPVPHTKVLRSPTVQSI